MNLTVEDILAPDGLVAKRLGGYERRDEQLDMARAVAYLDQALKALDAYRNVAPTRSVQTAAVEPSKPEVPE